MFSISAWGPLVSKNQDVNASFEVLLQRLGDRKVAFKAENHDRVGETRVNHVPDPEYLKLIRLQVRTCYHYQIMNGDRNLTFC